MVGVAAWVVVVVVVVVVLLAPPPPHPLNKTPKNKIPILFGLHTRMSNSPFPCGRRHDARPASTIRASPCSPSQLKQHGQLIIGNHRPNSINLPPKATAFPLAGRLFRTSVSRFSMAMPRAAMYSDPAQSQRTPESASHLRYDAIER
jgi:hypothetical protein